MGVGQITRTEETKATGPWFRNIVGAQGTSWKLSELKRVKPSSFLLFRLAWTIWAFKYSDDWASCQKLRIKTDIYIRGCPWKVVHIFPILITQLISLPNRNPKEHELLLFWTLNHPALYLLENISHFAFHLPTWFCLSLYDKHFRDSDYFFMGSNPIFALSFMKLNNSFSLFEPGSSLVK